MFRHSKEIPSSVSYFETERQVIEKKLQSSDKYKNFKNELINVYGEQSVEFNICQIIEQSEYFKDILSVLEAYNCSFTYKPFESIENGFFLAFFHVLNNLTSSSNFTEIRYALEFRQEIIDIQDEYTSNYGYTTKLKID